jgi:hypothetical protein
VYIRCPKCRHEQWLETRQRCELCGMVLRRCVDCLNYEQNGDRCQATGYEVARYEAENPTSLSLSAMCQQYAGTTLTPEPTAAAEPEPAAADAPAPEAPAAPAAAETLARAVAAEAPAAGLAAYKTPMSRERQFCVFLQNRPGRLAEVCTALADANINIVAMNISDTADYGVLRLVVDNSAKAERVIREGRFPFCESDVLVVEVPNRPGAMADIARRLAKAHINIEYSYFTAPSPDVPTVVILRIADVRQAQQALAE